jgi:hypothetical protein
MPIGTALWSAPAISGYTPQKLMQAVPSANGPDLYSIETDSSNDMLVRGLNSNGGHMWQSSISSATLGGGAGFEIGALDGGVSVVGSNTIVNLSPVDGSQNWQYTTTDPYGSFGTSPALGYDGTIFAVEQECDVSSTGSGSVNVDTWAACLDAINGNDGTLTTQTNLPTSSDVIVVGEDCGEAPSSNTFYSTPSMSPPLVGSDGAVYLLASIGQTSDDTECAEGVQTETRTYNESLVLLRNGVTFQTINTHIGSGTDTIGDLIPDGNGGFLVRYVDSAIPNALSVAVVNAVGVIKSTLSSLMYGSSDMILGDNNTALVTDGSTVVAFNSRNLSPLWTYVSSGGILTFVTATQGGGVLVNDSSNGVVQLDGTGTASAAISTLNGFTPFTLGSPLYPWPFGSAVDKWIGIDSSTTMSYSGPDGTVANSAYGQSQGGSSGLRATLGTVVSMAVHDTPGSADRDDHIPINYLIACNPLPGLAICQGPFVYGWYWEYEFEAQVSDDASRWTPKQLFFTESSETYINYISINQYIPLTGQVDRIGDSFKQNPSGQKKVFFIDGPGDKFYIEAPVPGGGYGEFPFDRILEQDNVFMGVKDRANNYHPLIWHLIFDIGPGVASNPAKPVNFPNQASPGTQTGLGQMKIFTGPNPY